MRLKINILLLVPMFASCGVKNRPEVPEHEPLQIVGTWRLLSGTLIEKGDTLVTDYTGQLSFIKMINDTHFAFFMHDLNQGKDSTAVFSSGGGSYTLQDNLYTEHLQYCSDRAWENNFFKFTVTIKQDTLVQTGVEKVESAGVDRLNIEKYVRLKTK